MAGGTEELLNAALANGEVKMAGGMYYWKRELHTQFDHESHRFDASASGTPLNLEQWESFKVMLTQQDDKPSGWHITHSALDDAKATGVVIHARPPAEEKFIDALDDAVQRMEATTKNASDNLRLLVRAKAEAATTMVIKKDELEKELRPHILELKAAQLKTSLSDNEICKLLQNAEGSYSRFIIFENEVKALAKSLQERERHQGLKDASLCVYN